MNPEYFTASQKWIVDQHSRRFVLNDPSHLFWIEKGAADLFAVEMWEGLPQGSHFFLAELKKGDLIFPFPSTAMYQIIVIASPGTALQMIETKSLEKELSQNPSLRLQFFAHFQSWVGKILHPFAGPQKEKEKVFSITSKQESIFLQQGERLFLEHIIGGDEDLLIQWLTIKQGSLLFLGRKHVLMEKGMTIPLRKGTFWEAHTPSELVQMDAAQVLAPHQWPLLLQQLYHFLLQEVETTQKETKRREEELAEQKKLLEERLLNASFNDLSSVLLEKPSIEVPEARNLLLAACEYIGRKETLVFTPPTTFEPASSISKQISDLCHASDIRFRKVRLTQAWWKEDAGTMLGFIKDSLLPVALTMGKWGSYDMFDPSTGTLLSLDAANAKQLSPFAYIFYSPFPNANMDGKKTLFFGFQNRKKELWELFWVSVGIALLNLFIPISAKIIIGTVVPELNQKLLWQVGGALFAAIFSSTAFLLTKSFLILRLSLTVGSRIEHGQWDHLLKLPVSFFKNFSIGVLWNKINSIRQIQRNFYYGTISTLLSAFFSIFYILLMLAYSVSLSLIGLAVIGIMGIFALCVVPYIAHLQEKTFLQKGFLGGFVIQAIHGIEKIRVTGSEKRAFAHWAKDYALYKKNDLKAQHLNASLITLSSLLPTLSTLAIFFLLIYSSQKGLQTVSLGDFFGFMAAYGALIAAVLSALPSLTRLSGLVKSLWKQAKVVFEATPEINEKKAPPGPLQGNIAIDQVFFRYDTQSPYVLKNISLKAQEGEFIGIVGPSGCGKSTLLRVLLGFESPEKGTVYYDGMELQHIDAREVRKQLGVVLQSSSIMAGTIYDNLTCGGTFSKEEVERAALLSNFNEDLKNFPMGLHTVLSNEGTTLSGGQKQRLLIARALISKPKILFFDEATSALDNRTQDHVSQNIDSLDVTRIVIAHRLSTIRHADRIYVMENGEIVDVGNFDELASRPGLFLNILKRQKI